MEYYKNLSLEDLFYINENGLVCLEEWRDVPDYEGIYKISNLGRMKSIFRVVPHNYSGVLTIPERIRTLTIGDNGYIFTSLSKNGIRDVENIHILVAIAFLNHKVVNRKIVVDHKDNIKTHNMLSNLQIITSRNNTSKDKNGITELTGVYECGNKFRARLIVDKKKVHLGRFDTKEEASLYYQNAVKAIENNQEIIIKKPNFKSQYKGVSLKPKYNRWSSCIWKNGKLKHLGYFDTEIAAHLAYEKEKALL